MKSTKTKPAISTQNSTLLDSTNIETIEQINQETQLNQQFLAWLEKEEYKHLAYSQF